MKQGTPKKIESNAGAGVRSLNGLVAGSFVPRDLNNILSIAFGLLAFTVLLSYSVKVTAPYVVGENLVLAEIYLPGFVIKPITLFTYLFFVSFAFGLSSPISKSRFLRMGENLFEAAVRLGVVLCDDERLRGHVSDRSMVRRASGSGTAESRHYRELVASQPVRYQRSVRSKAGCAHLCDGMLLRGLYAENADLTRESPIIVASLLMIISDCGPPERSLGRTPSGST